MLKQEPKKRFRFLEVYWTTITYRSVLLLLVVLLTVGLGVYSLFRPEGLKRVLSVMGGLFSSSEGSATISTRHELAPWAQFVNLEGEVRVRKANAVEWVNADYRTPLEEGDIVQTGASGLARISFLDGTIYVVKSKTLIVIERSATLENRATQVAVHITSGAVDLSTGTWEVAGSKSTVSFASAVAQLDQNTRAGVKSDPEARLHEITISEGRARVEKGTEQVQIGPFERASFTSPDALLQTEKVIAPPSLLRPRNLEPIISRNPREETIRFEWSLVPKAVAYRLHLYSSPLLTQQVLVQRLSTTSFTIRGLDPGEYWWNVTAIDTKQQESAESETNKFSLVPQPAQEELLLVIDKFIQHGRVIEVVGRTEPGATVIINDEQVAFIGPDGRFKHFTRPLPSSGAHTITITAQNRRGEVVTRSKPVYVR